MEFRLKKNEVNANEKTSVVKILQCLNDFGICVIEDFLSPEEIHTLEQEAYKSFELNTDAVHQHTEVKNGKASCLKINLLNKQEWVATLAVFESLFFSEIAEGYFPEGVNKNKLIYTIEDVIGTVHGAQDLHFDVNNSLKFLIYLTDTDKSNGAFSCIPKSVHKSKQIRRQNAGRINLLEKNKEFARKVSRELIFDPKEEYIVSGSKGTLIIFDTDTFHKAGVVSCGKRLVMRSHNYPKVEKDQRISFIQRVKKKLFR